MSVPLLIVVTGRPGSGKTTLAHTLARTIRCPAVCRDEIKEGWVNTFHTPAASHEQANRRVYDIFFQSIELLLRGGITLVAEAAFQHALWRPKLEPLQAIAQIRFVICSIDPALARARYMQRGQLDPERERYHGDWAVWAAKAGQELPINTYNPPQLPVPTLMVDTSEGYCPQLETIVAFAMQREGSQFGEP